MSSKEKIRGIYQVLPKLDCGFCGFKTCGQFARAVVEGRASPFGCRQNPRAGYRISEIIGAKVPAHAHGFQPASALAPGVTLSPEALKALREEVRELSHGADDILVRIENLKARI